MNLFATSVEFLKAKQDEAALQYEAELADRRASNAFRSSPRNAQGRQSPRGAGASPRGTAARFG